MARPTYEEATQFDNNDLYAILISGQNKDGTDWDGLLVRGSVDVDTSLLATEDTLQQVYADTTEIKNLAQEIANSNAVIQTNTDNIADVESNTGNILTEIQALNAKDFATETTQSNIKTGIDTANATLSTINNSASGAETNTGLIHTDTASIDTKMSTLIGYVDEVETKLSDANSNAGSTSDAAITSDTTGTISAKLRGIVKMIADVIAGTSFFFVKTQSSNTSIGDGHKEVTTAGTQVTLAASTACKSVIIEAYRSNTGVIQVGGSTVNNSETAGTGTGATLLAGDSIPIDIDNLSKIYINSTVNGEGVRFTYFN